MKFSVCIPNFNYASYLGRTIDSVLAQGHTDFEIPVADNNSTDASWEVIQQYIRKDSRVKASKNVTNLGFAGNLDAVSRMVDAPLTIMLSSDDLMNAGALETYQMLINHIGPGQSFIISSTWHRIDPNDAITGQDGPHRKIWFSTDIDTELSNLLGCNVYKVPAGQLLKRSLQNAKMPFNFAATCYRTEDYYKAGGYGGSRMMNPDKWFHFRLMGVAEYAYFIDKPLFSYRWHPANQTALQQKSGALKFFVDEYRTTFELDKQLLEKAGLTQADIINGFVYHIIHKYTFRKLKEGSPLQAFRILCMGFAAYPAVMFRRKYTYFLFLLVLTGKLGHFALKGFKKNFDKKH